jgi:hypothetical protein
MANLSSVRSTLVDGVHVFHGDDGRALLIVLRDRGKSLKIRAFVIADVLPECLEDALSDDEKERLETAMMEKRQFYAEEYDPDGLEDVAIHKYVRV